MMSHNHTWPANDSTILWQGFHSDLSPSSAIITTTHLLTIIIKKIKTDSLIPMLFDWSIDKLTRRDWQQKLMMSQHTAGSFVLCIRVLARKMAATDSYVFTVCKHALKPQIVQHA